MIKLSEISTLPPEGTNEKSIRKLTKKICAQIAELQNIMYAEKKHSILLILQGMDASGKDGTTREVFKRCSPIGVKVTSFKKPTEEEFAHDFLWRIHKVAPQKGMIRVFNRSHYEDILIQRVHNWIDDERVSKRMASINAFEKLLQYDNNTTIIKCYMHLSKERQGEKLKERLDDPSKNWKHNPADWKERELWDEYMTAYEYAINQSEIPWNIIPVDKRWYRNYTIAKLMLNTLKSFDMKLPNFRTNPELLEE